jgi:hypothetical protein
VVHLNLKEVAESKTSSLHQHQYQDKLLNQRVHPELRQMAQMGEKLDFAYENSSTKSIRGKFAMNHVSYIFWVLANGYCLGPTFPSAVPHYSCHWCTASFDENKR